VTSRSGTATGKATESANWLGRIADPITLIGVVTSVGIGVVFYIYSDINTAFGVFAGLLGIDLTLQVQAMASNQRAVMAEARYKRIVDAIERIQWMPDVIDKMLQSAIRVEHQYGKTPAAEAFRNSFQNCLALLADLERGHFTAAYGDLSMTYSLTKSCKKTLWATSVQDIDFTWWVSPRSQTYWTLQQDAIRRGVVVIRLFVYHDLTEELRRLVDVQRTAGVDVRLVRRDLLPPQLRTDMVIWDESCAYETRSNASGEPVLNFYTVSPQDVQTMIQQFQRILSNAEPEL
jgi:hypothetical protein